jgi:hypothetical protein
LNAIIFPAVLFALSFSVLFVFPDNHRVAIDPADISIKILANGECGCRGEDGDQSRLNASANLERPVQNRPFGFFAAD